MKNTNNELTELSAPGDRLLHRDLTDKILGAYYDVYRELGWGFVEGVYSAALAVELKRRGIAFETESPIAVLYRGVEVGRFRADFVAERVVVLELKAVDRIAGEHEQQIINYLKSTTIEVGLLLNFGPRPSFRRLFMTNDRKRPNDDP